MMLLSSINVCLRHGLLIITSSFVIIARAQLLDFKIKKAMRTMHLERNINNVERIFLLYVFLEKK